MSLQTVNFRAGTLALVEESTSGTLQKPAANTDFSAIQSDIAISPGLENLTNDELRNNIMAGKQIVGRQNPTFTMSHYFRAGDSGTEPSYGVMLKAAMGAVKTITSEQAITGVTDLKTFDVADASEYEKGDLLLIQASSGNECRPIESVVGNTITLAFELDNSPNIGALIGKPVTYQALNDSNNIPTLSAWYYLPDTIEALAGMRIEGVDISFPAGELINANYTGSGLSFFFDPLVIDASNDQINIDVSATPYSASIPQKSYADPHELSEAVSNALNAISGTGVVFACSYNDDGKYTITGDSAFSIDGTQANTILPTMAFDAVLSGALTSHTSQNLIDLTSGLTPVYDTNSDPIASKSNILLIGSATDKMCVSNASVDASLANTKADLLDGCQDSGVGATIFNERAATFSVTTWVQPYQARFFRDLRKGEKVSFFMAASQIEGGAFIKNKTAGAYASHCTITSLELSDSDGAAQLSMELAAFAPEDSTQSFYIGFV
ncbi:MAG: hypothetical protein GY718_04470 [Lentisphaerae bacterium]|nr:hypothetical protein [Lentisphaerota bacterium]